MTYKVSIYQPLSSLTVRDDCKSDTKNFIVCKTTYHLFAVNGVLSCYKLFWQHQENVYHIASSHQQRYLHLRQLLH